MLTIQPQQAIPAHRFDKSADAAATLIYKANFALSQLEAIEQAQPLTLVDAWCVGPYTVISLATPLTAALEAVLQQHSFDYASLDKRPDLNKPGVLVMDMDSTAIQIECIDEIAKLAGVGEQVAEVTERAMQGELDFAQSLRERVATLKDADESILESVRQSLPLMPEIEAMIATLKHYDWQVAIASGGFTYFSDHLKERLGLCHAESNTMEIIDGTLTGKVVGDIVDAQRKAEVLTELAARFDITPENCLAIGDGANDLPMIHRAALGFAFHAKPKVEAEAPVAIRYAQLGGLICVLSASLR